MRWILCHFTELEQYENVSYEVYCCDSSRDFSSGDKNQFEIFALVKSKSFFSFQNFCSSLNIPRTTSIAPHDEFARASNVRILDKIDEMIPDESFVREKTRDMIRDEEEIIRTAQI